jgi:hypothetical protein
MPGKHEWVEHKTPDQFDKDHFGISFHMDAPHPYRKEFADLRKAVKAYRVKNPACDTSFDTRGHEWWRVNDEFFIVFADWIELPDTLEALKKRAVEDAKIREAARKNEEEELKKREKLESIRKRKQYHQEKRDYRIPFTGPCKVRVLKITCYGQERYEPLYEDEPVLYKFAIEINEGQTSQEKKARYALRYMFCGEQPKKYSINTSDISGYQCNWKMCEHALRSYLDWLEFEEDFEILRARAVEDFEQEKRKREEERKRYEEAQERYNEEMRRAYSQYRREYPHEEYDWNPWQRRSQVSTALSLFDLDTSATQEDVKKKYRTLAKQYHPDAGGDAEKFKRLNQANQVLMQHFA